MLSCDTFVLPAEANFFGSNLMAKNSDRPIGEAQALTWTDGAEHARGETVRCTYISVPQAEKTYGVLGSNYTNDDSVKLFPRGCGEFVHALQAEMKSRTGRDVEVLVYGDGAFKDPVCGIWELADPVVSPGFTDGLVGLPKEIKFKYVADNAEGKDPAKAVEEAIRAKSRLDRFGHSTLGTTPRRLTDLIGSLCDLTSGSGDKGTPVVYIQGYFDSYLDD